MSKVELLEGDCREWLPTIAPRSVDVVIADPPYGVTSLDWDVPLSDWLGLILPVLKPSGSLWCFGSLRMFLREAESFTRDWKLVQDCVWEKHNGSNFHADRFRRVHEQIAQFYPKENPWSDVYRAPVKTLDAVAKTVRRKRRPPHTGHIEAGSYVSHDGGPRLMRSVIRARSCHGYAVHETQKPEAIIRPLIEYSCPPGGLVLDPFAGSGTVLVCAQQLGRNALGIEINPGYVASARRRLGLVQMPLIEEVS